MAVELEEERMRTTDNDTSEHQQPSTSDQGAASQPPPTKQPKLQFGQSVSQSKVSRLICEFVIDDVQAFSLVEQPSFKKLIEGISGGKTVMSRKTLVSRIEREFAVLKQSVTATLQKTTYVCTTADLWSAHSRSFFGMTCHWIDDTTLQRRSAALACARVKGRHTFDVLAAKISEIHTEYKLDQKVRATVTDNGSNFVKAFKEFDTPAQVEEAASEQDDGVR